MEMKDFNFKLEEKFLTDGKALPIRQRLRGH